MNLANLIINKNNNIVYDLKTLIKENFTNKIPNINDLLVFCTDNKCSDLYLKVGDRPFISRYGLIYRVPTFELTNKIWQEWAKYAITSENNAKYVRQKMLDFSYCIPYNLIKESRENIKISNVTKDEKEKEKKKIIESENNFEFRYRVSAGFSSNKNIASFRMISKELPTFNKINFPKKEENILKEIAKKRSGITMFCGVTGSGKSTTFASAINDFSKSGEPFDNSVMISLEDPVEYKYKSTDSFYIMQKELGVDFKAFDLGVKQALREHPNFINVGETRDKETINTLVESARTGHSVWTSFHSSDVADTISRLYNYLINYNSEIMYDLIANINLILCQRLIPSEKGFKLNTQYMVFNDSIVVYLNKMIEEGKNIPTEINKLFKNEQLIKYGLVKDWD